MSSIRFCALESLSGEAFDHIVSYLWIPDATALSSSSKCLKGRVMTMKSMADMLTICLDKTGRHVNMAEVLKDVEEGEEIKQYLKELTERITPYPTYFDWLANLVDWDKVVFGHGENELAKNMAKNFLVSVKLRPDSIESIDLKPDELHFRGDIEEMGMNSGRRALVYQGRKLGGNRCVVANDHFPLVSAVTTDLSDEFSRGMASRMDYPAVMQPSRIPFTKVVNSRPSLSCIAYYEVNIFEPKRPDNAKLYSTEWLEANPPCVAIGIAYPSPVKRKRQRPMSRTESGDDLRSFAIDSNSNVEHFNTSGATMAAGGADDDMEHDEIDEDLLGPTFRLRRQLPGWSRQSVGYHSDDGNLFNGDSFTASESVTSMREFVTRSSFGQSCMQQKERLSGTFEVRETFQTPSCPNSSVRTKRFGPGDVVGCGIIYPPLSNYFTRTYEQAWPLFRTRGQIEEGGILFFTKNGEVVYMTHLNERVAQDELPRIARPWFPCVGLDSYCPVEFNFGHSDKNPLALDITAMEAYLLELKDLLPTNRISISSLSSIEREVRQHNMRLLAPVPPLPLHEEQSNRENNDDSGAEWKRRNTMLSLMIRPLRLITSLAKESPVQQTRSGRCIRGNFVDWTRSLRLLPGSAEDNETQSYGLPPVLYSFPAPPRDPSWNDGILTLLGCYGKDLRGSDYYTRCNNLALDIAMSYEARRGTQPPLLAPSGSRTSLNGEADGSASASGRALSRSRADSNLSEDSRSSSFSLLQSGHFMAWEDVGDHLSAHSLFLNPSMSAAVKSLSRAYRLHSRVMLDAVVKNHRDDLVDGAGAPFRYRSQLLNLIQRATFGSSGVAMNPSPELAQMVVDSAVEEVWQMILPASENEEHNGSVEEDEDEDEDEDDGEEGEEGDGIMENSEEDEDYNGEAVQEDEPDSDDESLQTSSDDDDDNHEDLE